ncbi:hypothetical protein BTVI_107874 [Pitangus sulphuratus]|nr:hypothetical protein BTVI_107874 [Pitangus sulphuratus]
MVKIMRRDEMIQAFRFSLGCLGQACGIGTLDKRDMANMPATSLRNLLDEKWSDFERSALSSPASCSTDPSEKPSLQGEDKTTRVCIDATNDADPQWYLTITARAVWNGGQQEGHWEQSPSVTSPYDVAWRLGTSFEFNQSRGTEMVLLVHRLAFCTERQTVMGI